MQGQNFPTRTKVKVKDLDETHVIKTVEVDEINFPPEKAQGSKGRRTKFNRRNIRMLIAALEQGMTIPHAAAYANVSGSSVMNWMEQDEKLASAIEKAQLHFAAECMDTIRHEAVDKRNWQAASWYLERRFPNHYGKTVTEVTGGDKPVKVKLVWPD